MALVLEGAREVNIFNMVVNIVFPGTLFSTDIAFIQIFSASVLIHCLCYVFQKHVSIFSCKIHVVRQSTGGKQSSLLPSMVHTNMFVK